MNIFHQIIENSEGVLLGKKSEVKLVLAAFLAGGHILIEDIPGVGKTTLARWFANTLSLDFKRVQCTNDLLPADIIGFNYFDQTGRDYKFKQGPIFSELLLVDELNRASAKTQSALLQAMEEREVSVEGQEYKLPEFFTVIATQNPRQQIGTNSLPESQLDRFMVKMEMGYPDRSSEEKLLSSHHALHDLVSSAKLQIERADILKAKEEILKQKMTKPLLDYILDLLKASRFNSKYKPLGPRAGMDLANLSKSYSWLMGRDYVLPEDVQFLAPYVWGHRLVWSEMASRSEENNLVKDLIQGVAIP